MKARNFILGILSLIISVNLQAQEHRIPVQNPKDATLALSDFYENLPIEGYAGNEIIITSTSGHFETPERAKGLKPVYPSGTDNTGMALNVEQNGNDIRIRCLQPITNNEGTYKIKVPENLSLRIKSECDRNNSVDIQNMKNEVEVEICNDITLRNVTGPLVLSTISGNIDVKFGELNRNKPISIAAISGEVDVTLPAKSAVDLEMENISGSMFSDFDFNADSKDMKRVGGNSIKAKLNGGGTDLKITNISGNIYLRKG